MYTAILHSLKVISLTWCDKAEPQGLAHAPVLQKCAKEQDSELTVMRTALVVFVIFYLSHIPMSV